MIAVPVQGRALRDERVGSGWPSGFYPTGCLMG